MNNDILIKKLNDEIAKKSIEITNLESLIDNYKNLLTKAKLINANNEDGINVFSKLDIKDYFVKLNMPLDNNYTKFNLYQQFALSKNYKLTQEQIDEIKTFFTNIIIVINNALSKEEEKKLLLNEKINSCKKVLDSLNKDIFKEEDYKLIALYLMENNLNSKDDLSYLVSLSLNLLSNTNELEEVTVVTENNLDKEELSAIFKKNGYNLDDISDVVNKSANFCINEEYLSSRQYLLKYGNLDNIASILSLLANNELHFDVNKYSNQLSFILVNANPDNVSQIIENIKEDIGKESSDLFFKIFLKYLKRPSLFATGKLTYEHNLSKRNSLKIDSKKNSSKKHNSSNENSDSSYYGTYNNYILNRQLFKELGIDIQSSIDSCFSVFGGPHKTIKKNIEILMHYGISPSDLTNSLSCLKYDSIRLMTEMDQFIELGSFNLDLAGYNYIKNNLSSLSREIKPLYCQLANAGLSNVSINEIFHTAYKGSRYMTLCSSVVSKYLDDTIYIDGKPQVLFDTSIIKKNLPNIGFDNILLKYDDNLLQNNLVTKLERFKENKYIYRFGNFIISRNKVLRNISILLKNNCLNEKNIFYAIINNSILTENQYQELLEQINYVLNYDNKNKGGK